MKRILYFTGYRMVAQEWDGRKLNSSVYFEPDEQGLDLFEAYLTSLKNEPVRLLLDLIEEEFRQVVIPLLRGSDRQNIIDRNFSKFFRNSDYRYAISQQTLKKGRKEERLLLMGLTNQDLLKPWLEIVEKTRTPLSGILSVPLVSEDLVSEFKSKNKCVILVSQQVPSNLRQSVFLDGKLILSRLVPIASFYQGEYTNDVIRDIEGTQRYLVSQRIIDRNDVISVQILCNERHYEKLKIKSEEDVVFDYNIQNINDFIKKQKIEVVEEQDFSSLIFCSQACRKTFPNHYARYPEKKYFYHYITSLGTKIAGVILLASSIGLLSISLAKGFLYESSVTEMMLLQQKYESKFNQLNEQKIDSDISTINMKNVVQTVDKLKKTYLRSPREMMAMVSQDISLFNEMRVNELDWILATDVAAINADEQKVKETKPRGRKSRNRSKRKNKLFEIVTVSGDLLNFDGDYRYALSLIDDVENTMTVSDKYDQVEVLKRPLNIESNESLSGDVNVKVNSRGALNKKAEFTIRVVREVNLGVK